MTVAGGSFSITVHQPACGDTSVHRGDSADYMAALRQAAAVLDTIVTDCTPDEAEQIMVHGQVLGADHSTLLMLKPRPLGEVRSTIAGVIVGIVSNPVPERPSRKATTR